MRDQDFLMAIGVQPYNPELWMESCYEARREYVRTRFLQIVAILQYGAIIAGLIWTYR